MKMVVDGNLVRLGDCIGRGAEGAVYEHGGSSFTVVKIYHSPSSEQEEKIRAMVLSGTGQRYSEVAFPLDVVCDRDGNFTGFTMRKAIRSKPIHDLYTRKSRLTHFPEFDYRHIVHTAINLSSAVGVAHSAGYVVGDINESGVLVSDDTTVTLVDADSFQVEINGQYFPCNVGKPEYTPPELQKGKSLTVRTRKHDAFGLAVLIFQLLFSGRHPYAGTPKMASDRREWRIPSAISENQFAYSVKKRGKTVLKPPKNALLLTDFPKYIQKLFERSFGDNKVSRPNPDEWVSALTELESDLRQGCSVNSSHWYPRNCSHCTWCKVGKVSDMFPNGDSVSGAVGGKERNAGEKRRIVSDMAMAKIGSNGFDNAKKSMKTRKALWYGAAGVFILLCLCIVLLVSVVNEDSRAVKGWDSNLDGVISCAEAQQHGIAPVRSGHPAYRYMHDADGDGVVCERPAEDLSIPWDDNGN